MDYSLHSEKHKKYLGKRNGDFEIVDIIQKEAAGKLRRYAKYYCHKCERSGEMRLDRASKETTTHCGCKGTGSHQWNIGDRYGDLVLIGFSHPTNVRDANFHCLRCGSNTTKNFQSVRTGMTTTCGCKRYYQSKNKSYKTWQAMKSRCTNQKAANFPGYGGRGVTVCDRWLNSYENFLIDMGEPPTPQHSLHRLWKEDETGKLVECMEYGPGTTEWADSTTQGVEKKLKNDEKFLVLFKELYEMGLTLKEISQKTRHREERIVFYLHRQGIKP